MSAFRFVGPLAVRKPTMRSSRPALSRKLEFCHRFSLISIMSPIRPEATYRYLVRRKGRNAAGHRKCVPQGHRNSRVLSSKHPPARPANPYIARRISSQSSCTCFVRRVSSRVPSVEGLTTLRSQSNSKNALSFYPLAVTFRRHSELNILALDHSDRRSRLKRA
jgi:hypothetical protein